MLFICIKKDYTLEINRKRFLAVVSRVNRAWLKSLSAKLQVPGTQSNLLAGRIAGPFKMHIE